MSKFKGLFIEIFLEHWALQVICYLFVILFMTLALIGYGNAVELAIPYSVVFAVALKGLSAISSAIKAAIIIYKCNRGSIRFMAIYREWTGKRFDQ